LRVILSNKTLIFELAICPSNCLKTASLQGHLTSVHCSQTDLPISKAMMQQNQKVGFGEQQLQFHDESICCQKLRKQPQQLNNSSK